MATWHFFPPEEDCPRRQKSTSMRSNMNFAVTLLGRSLFCMHISRWNHPMTSVLMLFPVLNFFSGRWPSSWLCCIYHDYPNINTQDIPEMSSWPPPHKITWSSRKRYMDRYHWTTSPKYHLMWNQLAWTCCATWNWQGTCQIGFYVPYLKGLYPSQRWRPKSPTLFRHHSPLWTWVSNNTYWVPANPHPKLWFRTPWALHRPKKI